MISIPMIEWLVMIWMVGTYTSLMLNSSSKEKIKNEEDGCLGSMPMILSLVLID